MSRSLPSTRASGTVQTPRGKPGEESPSLVDGGTVLWILGLIVLTLVLTGPGLWSETWGWGWFDRVFGRKRKP